MNKGRWFVKTNTRNLPYLKAENANGRHILIQPNPNIEPYYMLADDICPDLLQKHHMKSDRTWKPGRMIVETSPYNYQVWIHSDRKLSIDEKIHWLNKLKSDPSATPKHRWGRCPGFRNRKEKYETPSGYFPLSKLIWCDWVKKVDIPSVNIHIKNKRVVKHLDHIHHPVSQNTLSRSDYYKGNESITDFSYALALARRGEDVDSIKNKILMERQNWDNHIGHKRINDYLKRTVEKAIKIVKNS